MENKMKAIELLAENYARSASVLHKVFEEDAAAWDHIQDSSRPKREHALAQARKARAALVKTIGENADLFEKPRTRTLEGVKMGFIQSKARVKWEGSTEKLIERITATLPWQVEALVRTKQEPVKDALAALLSADRENLGVFLTPGEDKVLVSLKDKELEKSIQE